MNEKTRAEDLAFQLIPRLNSAQRLERGDLLKSLLACSDEAEGKGIVEEMNQLNLKRREMQEEFSQIAMARAAEMSDMKGLVWVEGDEWLEGFSGLMASRLVQTYGRPAAVVKNVGDEWQASCRAPEGYHLKDALDEQSELLLGYGGHAQAAGFRVKAENAQALKEKMNLHFTELKPEGGSLGKLLILDEVPFAGIHEGLLAEIQKLEPFGHGHRRPLLATKGLVIDGQPRLMGPKKNHVSFRVFQAGQSSIEAIGFGLASELMALDQFGKVDLVYHLGRSPYSNAIQLQVQAVRQHKAPVLHRR
jgi:single-stranded-DNA-specific exonuclease